MPKFLKYTLLFLLGMGILLTTVFLLAVLYLNAWQRSDRRVDYTGRVEYVAGTLISEYKKSETWPDDVGTFAEYGETTGYSIVGGDRIRFWSNDGVFVVYMDLNDKETPVISDSAMEEYLADAGKVNFINEFTVKRSTFIACIVDKKNPQLLKPALVLREG